MAEAAHPHVPAQVVGNAFVNQYYQILHHSPGLVHRFYKESSRLSRPEGDGTLSLTTTVKAINEKILSLNYGEFKAEIISVDVQESFKGGVSVLVTGCLEGKDNMIQNFTQTFFLAPQEKGYFVLNDMFRYVGKKIENGNPTSIKDVETTLTPPQEDSPVQENREFEQKVDSSDVNGEEEFEIVDVELVLVEEEEEEEEVLVPEVVNEVLEIAQVETEFNSKIQETPKKSYASIVMVMKENPMPISSPARKIPAKSPEKASLVQPSVSENVTPAATFETVENGYHQEGEADSYSVYIRGLPMNATPAQLEEEFKKYGGIKYDGIQVRSNKGFCFGFVEFEEASAVDKAIEASPVMIGGRQAHVEEKKSTYTRASHRGHYSNGRGSGFRNEGSRGGRGNFGNGRGYNNHRGEFNGRFDFGNRGNNRGGSGNYSGHETDGFQPVRHRSNRGGGTVAKPVSATA